MEILLVDDDATDRELLIEALHMASPGHVIQEAENGGLALEFISQASRLPDLIFLDLNMPVKDGRETLLELKAHPRFRLIPVCIMSTSSASFDVDTAYQNGANMFLVKPMVFKEIVEMLRSLLTLFANYVTLPGNKPAGVQVPESR